MERVFRRGKRKEKLIRDRPYKRYGGRGGGLWLGIHKLHDFFWFKFSVQEVFFWGVKSLAHFFFLKGQFPLHELLLVHVLCLSPHNFSNGPSLNYVLFFSLQIFAKTTMTKLRAKSDLLTGNITNKHKKTN